MRSLFIKLISFLITFTKKKINFTNITLKKNLNLTINLLQHGRFRAIYKIRVVKMIFPE